MKNVNSKRHIPVIVFVFLLGAYQLSEFFLCISPLADLSARMGFAIYTFLPVTLGHSLFQVSEKSFPKWLYGIPLFFAGIALFHPNFILSSECNFIHVSIRSFIFRENLLWMFLYLSYYMIIPGWGFFVFTRHIRTLFTETLLSRKVKVGIAFIPITIFLSQIYFLFAATYSLDAEKVWLRASMLIIAIAAVVIAFGAIPTLRKTPQFVFALESILTSSFVTTLLLYILIPEFAYDFSSIFCQFSLLYAIAAVLLTTSPTQT